MENQVGTLVTFGLIFVFIYFLMVRPQKRARQQHERLVNSIEAGDEVMTTTGIFGTVRSVDDDEVSIEIAPGTQVRMLKRAIHSRVTENLDVEEERPEKETESA